MNYRTQPFIKALFEAGVVGRTGKPITINTLVNLEKDIPLKKPSRRVRDNSRVWTDEHLQAIKDYWLAVAEAPATKITVLPTL